MNVASKNDTAKVKIVIGILLLVIVGLAVYLVTLFQEQKEIKLEVEKQKVASQDYIKIR